MAISPSLSSAEILPGPAIPDTTTVVTLRVTARTTANAAPDGPTQVRVTPLTGGAQLMVDHEHVRPSFPDIAFSYTDANGVVDIPLRSGSTVTTQYLVEIGEDDGRIAYTENGQLDKPERDIAVGPQYAYTRTFATAQTIDEAWLAANNTQGGVTSRTIRQTLFAGPVTLAVDAMTGQAASIFFANCVFAVPFTENYCLETNNLRAEFGYCAFRGSALAAVNGEGGKFTRCVWDTIGRDGVRIEQGGSNFSTTGLPDDYTQTTFLSCLFRRVGIVTPGYCVRGTPMRNVVFDHVWFDVAHATAAVPQVSASGATPYGSCLGAVYQSTDIAGARGPRLIGCWIGGGETAQVTCVIGGSTFAPQSFSMRACRFDLDRAAPGCEYVIEEEDPASTPYRQGNMDDGDGRLIDDDDVNVTAGAMFLWPQTTLDDMPEVVWAPASSGGGPGGPGGPGSGPSGEIGVSLLGEDLLYTVKNALDEPVGGGNGGQVITSRPVQGAISEAFPILVGGVVIPPDNPLIVEWDTVASNLEEGGSETIFARLTTQAGGVPPNGELDGFSVPLTVAYSGAGSGAADFVIPAYAVFAQGASLAPVIIEAVDDSTTEGAEVATITLGSVTGLNEFGEEVTFIEVGDRDEHAVTILPNDAPGVVQVFMGLTALSVPEGPANTTTVQIPVRISGNPSAQVPVNVTFTGTATLVGTGVPYDYAIESPTAPGSPNVVPLLFQPNGPQEFNVLVRIHNDLLPPVDEPDETIVMTLTLGAGVTAAVIAAAPDNVCTVTIVDDDDPPQPDPIIGWEETDITLYEATIGPGGVPQLTSRAVAIRTTTAGQQFSVPTDVYVALIPVGQNPAYFIGQGPTGTPHDYDVLFEPPNQGTITTTPGGQTAGIVPFAQGTNSRDIVIKLENDLVGEGAQGEQFQLVIVPMPGYQVETNAGTLNVTILDPLGGDTELLVSRLQANTPSGSPPSRSLVSTSIYLAGGVTTSGGFKMTVGGESSTCQWHPLSYKPDGTPADVRVWAMLNGASASVPGQTGAILASGGTATTPTGLIDLTTQYDTVVGDNLTGLRLTLVHNVNGETREFNLRASAPPSDVQSVDGPSAATQGGGPALFRRRTVAGPLRADNVIPGGSCTVARMHFDCRADMNAVRVAINWGNYRWKKPTTTGGHKVANDYVDGEVFFDYLDLNGIPAGWAAVMLDPRVSGVSIPAITEYDAANSRVRIIRPLGGTARHYLPPLRGHMAYVVLYETATVSQATALEILNGYDCGYAFGVLGCDRNDFMGEQGTPMFNYGQGSIPFVDANQSQAPNNWLSGWAGAAAAAQRDLARVENAVIAGTSESFSGPVAQNWWHPFAWPNGGQSSGHRINITGGIFPSKWRYRRTMFELVHIFQRVGTCAWNENGLEVTDEDFCVDSGTGPRITTAMYTGFGNLRMAHQHFYVPDCYDVSDGVNPVLHLGPGWKRAKGTIALNLLPASGNNIIINDGNGGVYTFIFANAPLPSDTATNKYVTIGADIPPTLVNLDAKIRSVSSPTAFRIWSELGSPGIVLTHRYHGDQGNATITPTGAAIVTTSMAGGHDGVGSNFRLWNYLVPGTNTCAQDMYLSWFRGPMAGNPGWHSFDWPHMVRTNEPIREGWWCFFDPIAHDWATGLMHLATQCMPRFPEAREAESPYIGTAGATQLAQAVRTCNMALAREGQIGGYLKHYVSRGFSSFHRPASLFAPIMAANGGLNCGTYLTRSPQLASIDAPNAPANHFDLTPQQPFARGQAWLLTAVARGYAIDGILRPAATWSLHRTRLHPGINTEGDTLPSWFEMFRFVLQNTMHKAGFPSSFDINAGDNIYSIANAPPDFSTRAGSVPGGDLNSPVTGQSAYEDEWYAVAKIWMMNFMSLAAYAVNRRVYSWADRENVPNTQVQTNPWGARLRGLWNVGRLIFLASEARFGPQHYFPSTHMLISVGDPANAGTASSSGIYGRFCPEGTPAQIDQRFRTTDLFWWVYDTPVGNTQFNYYEVQYILWSWCFARMYGQSDGNVAEMLQKHPGLIGAGGLATIQQMAPGVVSILMPEWQERRRTAETENSSDEYAWAVQWHRNELGAT